MSEWGPPIIMGWAMLLVALGWAATGVFGLPYPDKVKLVLAVGGLLVGLVIDAEIRS